jgi:hypothetical protein
MALDLPGRGRGHLEAGGVGAEGVTGEGGAVDGGGLVLDG